jgi:dienelactone hydrolase
MRRNPVRVYRPMAIAAVVLVLATGLVMVLALQFGLQYGGMFRTAPGALSAPVTLEIPVLAGPPAASARQRSYKLDVWAPSRARAAGPVPLIVYISGWGSVRSNNRAMLTAVSDAGYAVLAFDDISQDAPYDDPLDEAARIAPFELATEAEMHRLLAAARRKAALQVAKVSQLLDRVTADPTLVPQFAAHGVRYDRVGILGYSFGGATAAELGKRDARVVAAVNIDGWQLTASADQIAAFPFLMINSIESRLNPDNEQLPDGPARNDAVLNAAESARQVAQAAARADGYRLYLRSSRHSDFSNELDAKRRLFAWLKSGGQLITARAARSAIDTVIVAFFDAHLRLDPTVSVAKAIGVHPDWVDLGTKPFR